MGGRYGGTDDGSDDYQDRRPDDDDRTAEQQTIADAVRTVAEQQRAADSDTRSGHADDSGRSDARERENGESGSDSSGGHHPLTALRSGTGRNSGRATLQDVDQQIAEYVADQLTASVEQAVEETDPDDSTNQ
jgi:hypothetical protein